MRFIDLNSLPRKYTGQSKRFYVDLSSISVVMVNFAAMKEEDEKNWHVSFSTAVGNVGIKCADETEADEIALKVIRLIEEVRALPLKTHVATAGDMIDKLKNL